MLVHRTKKLLVRANSVPSEIQCIISPKANRVDPDQAARTRASWFGSADLKLLCSKKRKVASLIGKGLSDTNLTYLAGLDV